MMADVKAARAFLATRREVVPNRIGIAGASIGANLAILFAAGDPTVRSLVLLSPGIDYRGLRPEAAMKKYGDRPALLVASQEDNYSTNSARQLAQVGRRRARPADPERRRARHRHARAAARPGRRRWWTGSAARCYDRAILHWS